LHGPPFLQRQQREQPLRLARAQPRQGVALQPHVESPKQRDGQRRRRPLFLAHPICVSPLTRPRVPPPLRTTRGSTVGTPSGRSPRPGCRPLLAGELLSGSCRPAPFASPGPDTTPAARRRRSTPAASSPSPFRCCFRSAPPRPDRGRHGVWADEAAFGWG